MPQLLAAIFDDLINAKSFKQFITGEIEPFCGISYIEFRQNDDVVTVSLSETDNREIISVYSKSRIKVCSKEGVKPIYIATALLKSNPLEKYISRSTPLAVEITDFISNKLANQSTLTEE